MYITKDIFEHEVGKFEVTTSHEIFNQICMHEMLCKSKPCQFKRSRCHSEHLLEEE